MSTADFLVRCIDAIVTAEVDPTDDDAVCRALVEAGIRPDGDGAIDDAFIARMTVAAGKMRPPAHAAE